MSASKTTSTEQKTTADLQAELALKRQELIDAKRGKAAGELVNTRVISTLRKEIARLHMAIATATKMSAKGEQ